MTYYRAMERNAAAGRRASEYREMFRSEERHERRGMGRDTARLQKAGPQGARRETAESRNAGIQDIGQGIARARNTGVRGIGQGIARTSNAGPQGARREIAGPRKAGVQGMGRETVRPRNTGLQGARQEIAGPRNAGPQGTGRLYVGRARPGSPDRRRVASPHAHGRRRKRNRTMILLKYAACAALLLGVLTMAIGGISLANFRGGSKRMGSGAGDAHFAGGGAENGAYADPYEAMLAKLLELNEEAADYVECYPERETYKGRPIDLTEDLQSGSVPLLMQWDKRWGYNAYGENMIGLAGCGPVCLTMAYLYYTGNTDMTPREMAAFANDNGYYQDSQGTKWSLWTEGVRQLGLYGEELSLDEGVMKRALDMGQLIVCSMGPGDFTTEGHFILIRGYDENGFYVNDPNRRSNSDRQWDYGTLQHQIRNLWALYG